MAQSRGQSLEGLVRELLRQVALKSAAAPNKLGTTIAQRFAQIGLKEPIEELRGRPISPLDFE